MAKKPLTKLSLKRRQSCNVAHISLLAKPSSIFGYAFFPINSASHPNIIVSIPNPLLCIPLLHQPHFWLSSMSLLFVSNRWWAVMCSLYYLHVLSLAMFDPSRFRPEAIPCGLNPRAATFRSKALVSVSFCNSSC